MSRANKLLILQHLSNGFKPLRIGRELNLSNRTVEKYIEQMREEHEAKTVTHLIAIVIRKKIIE